MTNEHFEKAKELKAKFAGLKPEFPQEHQAAQVKTALGVAFPELSEDEIQSLCGGNSSVPAPIPPPQVNSDPAPSDQPSGGQSTTTILD